MLPLVCCFGIADCLVFWRLCLLDGCFGCGYCGYSWLGLFGLVGVCYSWLVVGVCFWLWLDC